MAYMQIKGIAKRYGTYEAVRGIDIDIAEREFVVIVGPSGCGKSTLLRMIAGLETISRGDLVIDGQRMNDVRPADRGIAMVFQSYALYPHKTVEQNMGFALKVAKTPKDEAARKITRAAEILQLGPLLKRLPKELSGGQRATPRSFSSTNLCRTLMPLSGCRCGSNWLSCTESCRRRWSTSRTTRSKR